MNLKAGNPHQHTELRCENGSHFGLCLVSPRCSATAFTNVPTQQLCGAHARLRAGRSVGERGWRLRAQTDRQPETGHWNPQTGELDDWMVVMTYF